MSSGLTIRDLDRPDLELYGRLQRSEFNWTLGAITPDQHREQLNNVLKILGPRNKAFCLAAFVDGRFAGYAAGQPYSPTVAGAEYPYVHSDVGVVPQLAVVERLRRQGVGGELLREAVERMSTLGFSLAIAHITRGLRPWYEAQGWTVLPPGSGLAWIETNRPGSELMLPPDAPAELALEHTAAFNQLPLGDHGYDSLAFRLTGAQSGIIVASFFQTSEDAEELRLNCARSLIQALEAQPDSMSRLSRSSAMLLHLESLTRDEQTAFVKSRQVADEGNPAEGDAK